MTSKSKHTNADEDAGAYVYAFLLIWFEKLYTCEKYNA